MVNGNTLETQEDNSRLKPQHMQIFHQQPPKGYFEVGRQTAPALARAFVGRGGAQADYDGDGRMDIAVLAHGDRPLLLHNVSDAGNHWIALRLRQRGGNTHALGARVTLRVGATEHSAQAGTGGSYLSQHDGDLHFGLGARDRVDELTVRWPDGRVDVHRDLAVDRVLELANTAGY